MHNRIDIDHRHSLAISREIGERLQASLRVEPELPPSIRNRRDEKHALRYFSHIEISPAQVFLKQQGNGAGVNGGAEPKARAQIKRPQGPRG
jgi:hypothetical protein